MRKMSSRVTISLLRFWGVEAVDTDLLRSLAFVSRTDARTVLQVMAWMIGKRERPKARHKSQKDAEDAIRNANVIPPHLLVDNERPYVNLLPKGYMHEGR